MISWLRFDWNEQPTFEDVKKALAPFGLVVKNFENGSDYEFVICTPETTNKQIVESIIDDFDNDMIKTRDEIKEDLLSFIKE